MKALLDAWLPRLVPGWVAGEHFQCVPHEGKSDLDRSIPRKLSAWREPGVRFIIVRDNDGADCIATKAHLRKLCEQAGRADTIVRLICQELESWYLGDLPALAAAMGTADIDTPAHRKRYSDPDNGWRKPSLEVKKLAPSFQKGSGARAMAVHLSDSGNRSRSFQVFVHTIRAFA
ncbi:DUF4276 family protein [Pulveribacter suum]|nr:DUF4276 family protein [Pulveribacter suum]